MRRNYARFRQRRQAPIPPDTNSTGNYSRGGSDEHNANHVDECLSRDEVRGVVPKLIDLSEKVLFGDVWERPGLSKRDRSLITVAALTAMYRPEQLKGHTERALANGVTKDEIGELITHLAFYSGWPSAMSAAKVVKQVFEEKKA